MEAATIVLSPALQVIFDRLASPVLQKFADIWGLKDNIQSLQQALLMVQAILEDAEEQQFTNKAVRIWLSKLKDAASDAEDLLDFVNAKETIMVCGDDSGENFHHLIPQFKDYDVVRKMLEVLEMTVIEGQGLVKLNFGKASKVDGPSGAKRETSSFVVESEIYGREDEKGKRVKLLLSAQADHQEGYAACIPIIGIGGIGKTTLAQLAYGDERVVQHFDVRMWVFVSDDFNVKKIMKTIIGYVTKDECKLSEIDQLQSFLWSLLHNKRYLLVLDDVWTEDQDDWDKLRPLFRGGVDGCKIIVTTRSKKIPAIMDFPNRFYLNGLTDDDCLALFKRRAFGRGEEEKYSNLVMIGKQIVRKCGGVPLAARSLGSLMRLKRDEKQWLFIQRSELWKLEACQNSILPALMLSYIHLPSHLRQCFAFCSIFPKSYEFKKQKLIYLWMAEGLIRQEGTKRPEDTGDEYFADLLWMSFFQVVEPCDGGGISGYKMNDVIHDLAQYVAGKESVVLEHGASPDIPAQIRHSSVVNAYGVTKFPEALYEAEHLRTLLLIEESSVSDKISKLFLSFVYLRVLDLNSCHVTNLPESLGGMICLRYLDLSYTPISSLPKSTKNLCLLQTLNLSGCQNLNWLPSLERMTNLRHLNISGCESLTQMPHGIQMLRHLQTLPLFVVTKDEHQLAPQYGHGLMSSFLHQLVVYGSGISLLEHLNLHGNLNITNLENVTNASEARSAQLKMKENLESLGLYWGKYWRSEDVHGSFMQLHKTEGAVIISGSQGVPQEHVLDVRTVEKILEGLEPNKNLKMLVISGYPGIRFPHWALPNVTAVNLTNCKNCEHLPALGNLLLLKTLSLQGLHGVKHIGREFYGGGTGIPFSALEDLSVIDFPNLEDWSNGNNGPAFPSLRKLNIVRCSKLANIPLSQSLQHLELRDCNTTLISMPNLTLLSVLVIEKIPELSSLPEGLFASHHLSSLKILSCPKLRSLPLEMGNLTALKSLTIRWCEELSSLQSNLQNLKALESLEISNCQSLILMPNGGVGGLSSLRTFSIENCSNLISLSSSLENLTFLEHLTIMYCPNLGSFPVGVQHLSSLRSLTILSCPWFDSLPNGLQNVRTLHCLEISSCPNLTAFPEWFEDFDSLRSLTIFDCPNLKVVPAGLKLLTKLQYLSIQECPELEERCRQGSGEDWFKISHIPHKYIGSHQARQSSEACTSGSSAGQTSSQ